MHRLEAGLLRRSQLTEEVGDEIRVVLGDVEHRGEVVPAHGERQVGDAALLEELRREAGVGAEHQVVLAVDDTGVEVRHGHRGSTLCGLAVDLRLVAGDEFLIRGAQEDSGDREAAEAASLGDAGLLQQRQSAAAGTDEDELRAHLVGLVREQILDGESPSVGGALEIGDLMAGAHGRALVRDVAEQLSRQRAEVDVGALLDPRDAVDLSRSATFEHQRQPFGLGRRVVGVLHVGEQRVAHHGLVAVLDVVTALVAAAVADVGDGVDERLRIGDDTGVDEVRPVLARVVELLVDVRGLLQVDMTIGVSGGVVEFAECGVAGAGIVPGIRALR